MRKIKKCFGPNRRQFLASSLLAIGAPLVSRAKAQGSYPTKAIRIIVPFAAGALTDSLGRVIGQKLQAKWGQSVVVENISGAGGVAGTAAAARSAPDGHTLVLLISSHASNQTLMSSLPYDSLNDFAPITLVAKSTNVLLASNNFLRRTENTGADLRMFLDYAKGQSLLFGHSGTGNMNHLVGVLLGRVAGIKLEPVPYRGGAAAMNDLVGAHLDLQVATVGFSAPFVRDNRVSALGVTSEARHPVIPNVLTFKEVGVNVVADEWWGLAAPARTPPEIIRQINTEVRAILDMPDVISRLNGADLVSSSPEEFDAFIRSETTRWGEFIRTVGIRIN